MQRFPKASLRIVDRRYGSLTVLANPKETGGAVLKSDVKRLEIQTGQETSFHYHLLAESIFVVVQGHATAHGDDSSVELAEGDVLLVPARERHRISNPGPEVAILIETQNPPYAVWDTFPSEKERAPGGPRTRDGRFWHARDSPRVRVKVCGIRSLDAAQLCSEAGVDAVGLNLTYDSKGLRQLDNWLTWIPSIPEAMSVFVLTNSVSTAEVRVLAQACNADTIQLQGQMSVEEVRHMSAACHAMGVRAVKSVGLATSTVTDVTSYAAQVEVVVDAVLFDSSWRGGTGAAAEPGMLADVVRASSKIVIVAGGLTAANVGQVLKQTGARSVDVESGVEVRLGGIAVKSASRVKEFIAAVEAYRQQASVCGLDGEMR